MTNIVEWKDEELPPVGVIVEFCDSDNNAEGYTSDHWSFGDRLECVAHRMSEDDIELIAVFWNIDNRTSDSLLRHDGEKELYRKVKTDREKTIEAAADAVDAKSPLNTDHLKYLSGLLFDAGMLKLPD